MVNIQRRRGKPRTKRRKSSEGSEEYKRQLHHIAHRHPHPSQPVTSVQSVVDPVFVVVFILPLVVEPRGRVSSILALRIVRTSRPLIIFAPNTELRPSIFGQIMEKSLTIESYLKTLSHHQNFMLCDCLQSLPCCN